MIHIVRPIPLIIISGLLIITPFLNLYEVVFFGQKSHWLLSRRGFNIMSILGYLMVVSAVFSGIGIYYIRRWGWYLFHFFAVLTLGLSIYRIQSVRNIYAWSMLGVNLVIIGITIYIVSRNVRQPYFSNRFRGWRLKKRLPLNFPVRVSDSAGMEGAFETTTIDFSENGALITIDPGTIMDFIMNTVYMEITLGDRGPYVIECEAVNVRDIEGEDAQAGLRFINMDEDLKGDIEKFIDTRYTPRIKYQTRITTLNTEGEKNAFETFDISTGGCYIAAETHQFQKDDPLSCRFYIRNGTKKMIQFKGSVSWLNPQGLYDKPPGFGVTIETFERGKYPYYSFFLKREKKFGN